MEAALLSLQQGQLEQTEETRENALKALNAAIKGVATGTKGVANTAKDMPEELGGSLRYFSVKFLSDSQLHRTLASSTYDVMQAGKTVVGTIEDPVLQRTVLNGVKALHADIVNLAQCAQSVAQNPTDDNLNKLLAEAGKNVAAGKL